MSEIKTIYTKYLVPLILQIQSNWKYIVIGISGSIIFICIILSLPLKTITSETTETYYTTEMKQESYIEGEPYFTEEIILKTNKIDDGFHVVVPGGIFVRFTVDKPDTRLFGRYENSVPGSFAVLGIGNRIIWEDLSDRNTVDIVLPQGEYQVRFQENIMWGESCYLLLSLEWPEKEQVIHYREVIKYRMIPVQSEQQVQMIKKENISLWAYIFSQ